MKLLRRSVRASGLVLMLLLSYGVVPVVSQTRKITAEGYGTIIGGDTAQARDEAIVDARVRALEQVAGVFIESTTLVQNAMLLDALIRGSTQGLITDHRVLKEGPMGDGRYRVQIEAREESHHGV